MMQLVWPGEDLTKHRHASRARSRPPVTFTRCRCSTLEPVTSAQLPLDSDDVTYFETYDSESTSITVSTSNARVVVIIRHSRSLS